MNNYILYLYMHCPDCLSDNIKKSGFVQAKTGMQQRYECKECGRTWVGMGRPKIPVVGIPCPDCHGQDIARKGWRLTRQGRFRQYVCRGCGHIFTLKPLIKRAEPTPCPKCHSDKTRKGGKYIRNGKELQRYVCNSCHSSWID